MSENVDMDLSVQGVQDRLDASFARQQEITLITMEHKERSDTLNTVRESVNSSNERIAQSSA